MNHPAMGTDRNTSGVVPPIAQTEPKATHTHSVQFYEDDSVLLDGLSRFVGSVLGAGGTAIVVASKTHRDGLVQRLSSWNIDLFSVATNGRYIAIDAAETLTKFMVDGWPDETRLNSVLSDLLLEASVGGGSDQPRPVIVGEMVALLWAEGNVEAAVRLEQLWNQLAVTHSFDLRCAYPICGFGQESHGTPFQMICAEHSHVIPAESYMSLENEEERLQQVSRLQQKAQALQEIGDERERLYKDAKLEIARRIAAEAALRESEEFSRGILENSVDCLQVMDIDGTVLYTSPAGQKALAIEGNSPVKARWMDGWTGEGRDLAFSAALAGGIGSFQGHCTTTDGSSKYWDIKLCPIFGKNGQVERLISISREITEIKQMQFALIQAEKLAATGRLAATIAHELNNPLDAVANLIYLAKTSGDPADGSQEYLEMADHELARVTHIAQQTLGFYRNRAHPIRVNVSRTIASVLAIYDRRLQYKDLRIQHRMDEDLGLYTSVGELKQILSNLISNAIDASRDGGTIWLRARRSSAAAGTGTQGVRITLADNGTGMSADVQKKIFTPFFTTKADVGTGIGLWITRSLLEKQGGAIYFRSWQGSKTGTVMSLFVPNSPSQ